MENPIKMDDLGVLLFLETPIYINIIYVYQFFIDWSDILLTFFVV